MKRSLSVPMVIGIAGAFFAQAATAQTTILDSYIKKGLEENLALHQKTFDLQKAEVDLKRAKTLFYPQASLNSQYSLAMGGRTQDIPIGDLLNNVYSTLNQLTSQTKFPQVENQKIAFLPNDFHDTRLEVSLPLVNTDLYYNKAIKQELINTQHADIEIYKRELVKNIKEAYYQYLQGRAVIVQGGTHLQGQLLFHIFILGIERIQVQLRLLNFIFIIVGFKQVPFELQPT